MNFNFKKIASAASSILMMGSTVALAAAANYPAPFVSGDTADVAFVYGSSASVDLASVLDLSNQLSVLATGGEDTSGSGSTPTGGDFVELAKSSDNINLGNVVSTVFGTSVNDDDLPVLLADGTYSNDDNDEFDYEQTMVLGTGLQLNFFSDSDYLDEKPTIGFNLTDGATMINYSLDFVQDAESEVSGGDLVDLETTTIRLLGKDYFISDVDNSTLEMTLLDAANSATVTEGETTTLNAGAKSYSVAIDFIDADEVRLIVNGETTNKLNEGETQKLSDGSFVGIKTVDYNAKDAGVSKADVSIGNGKIELTSGSEIKINDDTVDGLEAEISRGSLTGGKQTLDRISLVWKLDDEQFVTPNTELVMPGFASVKFSAGAFVTPEAEVVEVKADGDNAIRIDAPLKDGTVSIPILYAASSNGDFIGIGKSSTDSLKTSNHLNLVVNDSAGQKWAVASWNTSDEGESYLLSFEFERENGINMTTVSKETSSGSTTVCEDKRPTNTCTIGNVVLTFNSITDKVDGTVNMTINAGGSWNSLYTKTGLKAHLPFEGANATSTPGLINFTAEGNTATGHNNDTYRLVFREENKDDDIAAGNQFNLTLNDNSDNELEVTTISSGRETFTDPADTSDYVVGRVYSDLATLIELNGQSSDQREATVTYSGSEAYGQLFLSTSDTTVGSGSTNSGVVTVTDSEISTVSTKNLIVVGGSCINTVARDLLGGSSALCGSDFTSSTGVGAGQFLIQSFANPWASSKVALLVAGYEASDTKNAATYLKTQTGVDTTVGKKYVGTSASQATLQVS